MQKPQFFTRKKPMDTQSVSSVLQGMPERTRIRGGKEKRSLNLSQMFSKPWIKTGKETLFRFISFTLLLFLYLVDTYGLKKLFAWRFTPKRWTEKLEPVSVQIYNRCVVFLDKPHSSISRIDLIELSLRNMQSKKTRTMVTVGGMAIGIGAIVFLVSIGYGLQQLVVTRVARLDEMKQADVFPQTGGRLKITDKTLSDFRQFPPVQMALPLIAVVGRVTYQNSVSDMAVYGVTADYLRQSAIKPIVGRIFDSNELSVVLPPSTGEVAGAATKYGGELGDKIQDIDFTINPNAWIKVRETPSTNGKILGYTKRIGGTSQGEEVWGSPYVSEDNVGKAGSAEDGSSLGKWLASPVLLWKMETCDSQNSGDCEEGKYVVLRSTDNKQVQKIGYFAEVNVAIAGASVTQPKVLGIASSSAETIQEDTAVDWVDIASESGIINSPEVKTVDVASSAKKQAVVNTAMLKVLGLTPDVAIGKVFSASFVVTGDLLSNPAEKLASSPTEYTIVGVIPEDKTPFFYVPFIDLRSLGVANFSQVKVVVNNQSDLSKVRRQIEAGGYITHSVADTVAQINSLFGTARTVLALLGMVALAVAALGMFNTLTVSLLERTREVGLMKAMGMKSKEVQELFLTESMIMGFFGGLLGIVLGFLAGKVVGVILSFFSVFKGAGLIDIAYIPFPFVLGIIFLSLIVGIFTGIYPAKRATKISALNALRYE